MARHRELIAALLVILAVTAVYAAYVRTSDVPAASGLVGHSLGVLGFTLMILTEVMYSFRKRALHRPRGSMQAWLQVHIFTGIVGPYLVLLHSAWHFNGLAGALTIMTVVVVISGFIGRYIYTAVPRTAEGVVIEAQVLQLRLDVARHEAALAAAGPVDLSAATARHRDRDAQRRMHEIERQMGALRWARRVMATWHTVHIPLGMAMFVTGFAHIGAAMYYATLLR